MLTDDQIGAGYKAKHGRDIERADLEAFKRMMAMFDCEDATDYADASNKILASMEIFGEELEQRGY